jgi:hypothetical protein
VRSAAQCSHDCFLCRRGRGFYDELREPILRPKKWPIGITQHIISNKAEVDRVNRLLGEGGGRLCFCSFLCSVSTALACRHHAIVADRLTAYFGLTFTGGAHQFCLSDDSIAKLSRAGRHQNFSCMWWLSMGHAHCFQDGMQRLIQRFTVHLKPSKANDSY